jgi:predicted regulator of Ras-like GTPase activity (Roadblock/LC7/MglB family)
MRRRCAGDLNPVEENMFQDSLKRLVSETEGGMAGILMGFDGIPVETYSVPSNTAVDMQTVGMEFSFVLTQVRRAADILEVGALQEVAIRTDRLSVLIRVVSNEYFVALAIAPEGNLGKGRYLLRVVAPKIQSELT